MNKNRARFKLRTIAMFATILFIFVACKGESRPSTAHGIDHYQEW